MYLDCQFICYFILKIEMDLCNIKTLLRAIPTVICLLVKICEIHSYSHRIITDQTFTIEIVVAFDHTIERFHNRENVKEYVLSLMLGASNIYADPSIGNRINLSVKEIFHMKDVDVKVLSPDENGKFGFIFQ